MLINKCPDGCCTIKIKPYVNTNFQFQRSSKNNRKAGVFIYDPSCSKVLMIQSKGNLWGSPKGTVKQGETDIECAIREVKEETGIDVLESDFLRFVKIKNKAVYFYIEMLMCDVDVQDHIDENDANGIGWINIDCLEKIIKNGNIKLNQHSRFIFKKFLNKNY
jgi:mRNA-decapping enzyme subunit 2